MDEVTKQEHQTSMGRIHRRTDDIEKSVARQEVIVERIEKSVDKFHEAIFNNGLVNKIGNHSTALKIHLSLIMLCLASIIGSAFFIIRSLFK